MYRQYLQKIAAREKGVGIQCSVDAPTANDAREPSHPQGPTENQRESTARTQENGQDPAQIRIGTRNPETGATPRPIHSSGNTEQNQQPKKELTEAQKEDIRKKKEETEKMIPRAFPFQEAIVVGNFLATFPNTTKIIRIFTSSTFTDTKFERNSWMTKAYPKIKEHCFSKGYEFQVVDMRWGVRNQATDDHMTTELCMHELNECHKLSKGPAFVSLLAHKYGYRSLSRVINGEEFQKIQSALTDRSELTHLSRWYIMDENAVPSTYLLKPVSKNIPDFLSEDSKTQAAAKKQWWEESERLMEIIARGAASVLDENDAKKYMISVTEQETDVALNAKNSDKTSFWFRKEFKDVENQAPSYTLSRYIECNGNVEVWQAARAKNKELKKRLENLLTPEHIYTYHVDWTDKGIDPTNTAHAEYLDKITTDFQQQMIASIDKSIEEREKNERLALTPDSEEFMKHAVLVQEKCEGVRGRDAILQKIKEYVLGDNLDPLVVHGESGCGKTSIMALAAAEAFHWLHGNGMVVMRFLGSTQESSNIVTLLQSVISQISRFFEMSESKPQDIQTLIKKFQSCLEDYHRRKKHLVMFIDSVDQLDRAHNGRLVASWIPKNLISHVKIIISTIDHPDYGVFPDIKNFVSKENFILVPLLTPEDRVDVLDHWFERNKRKLTDEQRSYALRMFEKCPLPLYFKLSFREALEWTSFRPIEECRLQDTIRGTIDHMFTKLETKHGNCLVSRALGYVTIAKHGLSEFELEDILSCDDDVLNDVYQFWTPPTRRLPPLLVVRLRYDLNRYLVSRGDSGIQIMSWYHRQFWEAAEDRYTSDPAVNHVLHTGIADYFLGRWAGETPKPYTDKQGEASAIRYVASQPVKLGSEMNGRKLKQLPYHLAKSANLQDLKKACLLNFDFLIHKMFCSPIEEVLEDFTLALSVFPGEEDLVYLSQAINLSSPALSHDPRQLPAQILERLENTQCLSGFLDQCRHSSYHYVVCSHHLLKKPGGQLVSTLTGHNSVIDSLDLHQDPGGKLRALTASTGDNMVKVWDVHAGKEMKSLAAMEREICKAMFLANGDILLQVFKRKVYGCNFIGDVIYKTVFEGQIEVASAGKRHSIFAVITEKNEFFLFDSLTGNEMMKKEMPPGYDYWGLENMVDFEKVRNCNALYTHKGFITAVTDDEVVIFDETMENPSGHFPHPVTLQDARTCDMNVFVSISQDNVVRVWDRRRKDIKNKMPTQEHKIREIHPMKNPRYVLVRRRTTGDKTRDVLEVQDLLKDVVVKRISLDSRVNNDVLVDDDRLVMITDNDRVKAISINTATVVSVFEGFASSSMNSICLLNGGKELVTQTRGKHSLKIYDTETEKVTKIIECTDRSTKNPIKVIEASSDGHIVACLLEKYKLVVCDVQKGKVIKTITNTDLGKQSSDLNLHLVSRNGTYVVGSYQFHGVMSASTPFIWNKDKDECMSLFHEDLHIFDTVLPRSVYVYNFDINDMIIIKDELLVAGYIDGSLRIWDIKMGKLQMKLGGHTETIDLIGVPDGPLLMSYSRVGEENLMRIWDVNTWECLASYRPEDVFKNVKTVSDGKSFIATSNENVIHITLNDYDKKKLEEQEILIET